MADEWHVKKLAQLGRIVTGKTPPSSIEGCFSGTIPFVTPTDLDGRRIIHSTRRNLTERGADTIAGSRIPAYAVMVSCIGSDMGKVAIAAEESVTNQQINSIVVDAANDPFFVYYSLSSRKAELQAIASGSAQPILNKSAFGRLDILLPELREQRAVAHVLGGLDDKIELNRRTNEALEAMARALFKSWFVDFDPIRAKAQGRDTGLPLWLAEILPDKFDNSERGEIPKGWRIASILDHASLLSGGTPKTDRAEYWDGVIPWASAKDVSQCREAFLINTERTITESGLEKSATQIIPRFATGVVARGATTGRMVLFSQAMAMNQTCYALTSKIDAPFTLYCQLHQEISSLVNEAHGSVFDTITTSTFSNNRSIIATGQILTAFEKIVSPYFTRLLASCKESRTLSALRDTLLPKLISGELRVKTAEKMVEAVA